MEEFSIDIAKKIKMARITAEKTQVYMAQALEVSRQTYLDAENGKTEVKVSMLKKISKITNFPIGWFLSDSESTERAEIVTNDKKTIEFLNIVSKLPDDTREELLKTTCRLASLVLENRNLEALGYSNSDVVLEPRR